MEEMSFVEQQTPLSHLLPSLTIQKAKLPRIRTIYKCHKSTPVALGENLTGERYRDEVLGRARPRNRQC